MKHLFVHQGVDLSGLDKTFLARRAALKKTLRDKHADELSKAGLFRKLVIH